MEFVASIVTYDFFKMDRI